MLERFCSIFLRTNCIFVVMICSDHMRVCIWYLQSDLPRAAAKWRGKTKCKLVLGLYVPYADDLLYM